MTTFWPLLMFLEEADPLASMSGTEWLGLALLASILAALGALLVRLGSLEKRMGALDNLGSIEAKLRVMADSHSKLELRRLEHLLVDIRDGQQRSDQRLAQAMESREREQTSEEGAPAPIPVRLGERIINRLLAQGYERIEILTPAEDFEAMLTGEGDVRVEARRGGAAYKGRVHVQAGSIIEVKLRAPFDIFP